MNDREIAKQARIGTLKALLGAVPLVGDLLNESFEIRSRIKQERLNKFVEELGTYMSELKEVQLEIHQINREDFSDFFEAVMRNVANNRSARKKDAFRNLLVNQIQNPVTIDYAELYNEIIGTLHEKQIPLLIAFNHSDITGHIEFQRDLSNRIQFKNSFEKQINTPNKFYDDEGNTRDDYELSILKQQISKLDEEIEYLKERLKTKYYPTPEEFGMENPEFYYLVQDLCNKGLLLDMSSVAGNDPYTLVNITEIGIDLTKVILR